MAMSSIKKLKFKTALFMGSIGSYISSYEIPDTETSSFAYEELSEKSNRYY